jgi:hypothetical protein
MVVFSYKIQFLKFEETPKTERFSQFINRSFQFIDRFSIIFLSVLRWFLFKIQILNEKDKPIGFSGLSLDFPRVFFSKFLTIWFF